MTMTDEAKALAKRASIGLTPYEACVLARYIEDTETRHAAELREQAERFSEVAARVKRFIEGADLSRLAYDCPDGSTPSFLVDDLTPFILPKPDPLVEVLKEEVSHHAGLYEELAERVHAALAAHGGRIVWGDDQ